jgi:surfactin synthase thioesterase subunit
MTWRQFVPNTIEVLPARLPGREARFHEPLITAFPVLVESLAAEIEPLLDRPFAFFGHSLGALVAFELARLLRKRGVRLPGSLLVAARSAPHLEPLPPIYHLPSEEFLTTIQRRYGAFDDEIRQDRALMSKFEPILRADFTLFDTYRYSEDSPLECPVIAYGGSRDGLAMPSTLHAWQRHTSGEFGCRIFEGGHFFFEKDRIVLRQLLDDCNRRLVESVSA